MRQLFPVAADSPDLPGLYAYPAGPWLRANMVSSVDGAATLDGATRALSSETDRHVFALLRTLSDVVVVGAATVREEHYNPVRPRELWRHLRAGRPATPPIAVVSGRLDLDRRARSSPRPRRTPARSSSPPPRRRPIAVLRWPPAPTSSWPASRPSI